MGPVQFMLQIKSRPLQFKQGFPDDCIRLDDEPLHGNSPAAFLHLRAGSLYMSGWIGGRASTMPGSAESAAFCGRLTGLYATTAPHSKKTQDSLLAARQHPS
jgi:hypothetical protein